MYSSTLPLTSALDVGRWSTPHPAALPPGKTRYPLYRRLGGPQGRSGRVRKTRPSPGFDPRTVQPVAIRYTGWAIAALSIVFSIHKRVVPDFCKWDSNFFVCSFTALFIFKLSWSDSVLELPKRLFLALHYCCTFLIWVNFSSLPNL